ncbi:uncharacterized protein [Panulirus ornatus]|uniref:uncharacterized protein isoform X3 n=1 Tax=Panulirus ornatus TaxID=150431 RepID=UPI003A89A0FC
MIMLARIRRALPHRHVFPTSPWYHPRLTAVKYRFKTTKSPSEELDLDEPIKFSTSRAATWKARDTYGGKQLDTEKKPWYQPFVVSLSLTIFLLYFCIFREESNLDHKFERRLYDHIEGLEESQLELSLRYNIEAGLDTAAILKRLEEIKLAKENGDS